ncbi:protein of unknown function [Taphrina deformans PYCC 5710]|uniref:HbrB-domain-containing protein n=1 Tax=Taphrina deformans (strain PYCC 5710 / ATCC 11124 / CBS 356.35 / IMI 108563 / JCM 9778 / NBRC 8474) TaxID=1097556 RepID=R4XI86_TAPDE|nr:protein of unknown function [Taphrina deformans PYCC 5710]|eukprot:CCG84199.1 protein of unknown function [Taphrina deformans PYCC 5710]
MSRQSPHYREPREDNEDSDSSDGTNPPTPKKPVVDKSVYNGNAVSAIKHNHGSATSPITSPNKNFGLSPKRTLFSRPSKMNLSSATRDIPINNQNKLDGKEIHSPTSPHHYFPSLVDAPSQTTSTTSSFTTLLKHAGTHVPHPHLHSSSSSAKSQGPAQSGSSLSNITRGRSFDLLRLPNSSMDSAQHQPISPSFFSSGARAASSSNAEHDDNWPLICARVLPLFNGEGLRQPIEDLNRLVSTHLARVHDRHEEVHVVEDLTELFETGIRSLDNNLASFTDEKLISRLSEIWVFFFSTVLPYLEATFLPLTVEFGSNPTPYASPQPPPPPATESQPLATSTTGPASFLTGGPTISTVALKSYRDILILPLHPRLYHIFSHLPLLLGQQEVFNRLLQCISVLRRVQSGDERQRQCDGLGNAVLFRRAKGRGDRRGIIGRKGGLDGPDHRETEHGVEEEEEDVVQAQAETVQVREGDGQRTLGRELGEAREGV